VIAAMKPKQIYLLSACFLFLASVFSVGYFHPDEHFQILEFAGLKMNMTTADHLPWEYQCSMRPAIQPALVVLTFHAFNYLNIDSPFTIVFILRLFSAGISFLAMYLVYKAYIREIDDALLKKWFLHLSFLLWFIVYISVRFSSETWSGSLFLSGFALLHSSSFSKKYHYLLIGLLLGLSFLFRYQTGLLIAGLVLWELVIKKNIAGSLLLITGILILAGIGMLIDRWYYDKWIFTAWNYFDQNIILNKAASGFGTEPWWYYFDKVFIKLIPPFSLVYILGFIIFFIFNRKDMLTWTVFPFLLIHFVLGHKELRFLFPVIGFLPVVIIKSAEIIKNKWKKNVLETHSVKLFVNVFWLVNLTAMMVVIFNPANIKIPLFKKLYDSYHSSATLYYMDENPYHMSLDVYFYKRSNLGIVKINSLNDVPLNKNLKQLFVTQDKSTILKAKLRTKQVYSTFPGWLKKFDFNNWFERYCWYVYEIE
jgi:phosphatidylinositol glycan class B